SALVRLWREKRGEAEPQDLSGNLVVQLGAATEGLNRSWYERNTRRRGTHGQRPGRHSAIPRMVGALHGPVGGTRPVFESKFMPAVVVLRRGCRRKVYGPGTAQHVGHALTDRRTVDHYRRRQMGRNHDPHRPALP